MPRKTTPAHIRVLDRVKVTESGCWMFQGHLVHNGYGQVAIGSKPEGTNKMAYSHRVVYEALVGPILEGLKLDHLCHNRDQDCPGGDTCRHRACVNPAHLEVVTQKENSQRGKHPSYVTQRTGICKYGHNGPWVARKDHPTRMWCQQCNAERSRRYYQRQKAKAEDSQLSLIA
jgi:hypothetical protein